MITSIDEAKSRHWDVIIVGTGMGGATLGYALAKAGKRVLFCEKGMDRATTPNSIRGQYAEMLFPRNEASAECHRDVLARAGRWADQIEDISTQRIRRYLPFIGAGSGGSSSLYGMALERFYADDFSPRANFPNEDEADVVEQWPISYDDLRPYYRQIESLYSVRGGIDPLRSEDLDPLAEPTPMSAASTDLFHFFSGKGLHPYRLPLASDCARDCIGCQGFLCPSSCKKDASNTCLQPAVQNHRAVVVGLCRVNRLTSNDNVVTGVECTVDGIDCRFTGETIILAAGALESPVILLRSQCDHWPNGLANRSGLVGRNLMRHYVDLYAVAVKASDGLGGGLKQLALNDLYHKDGFKGGTIQSFGALPPASMIAAGIQKDLRSHGYQWLTPAFQLAKPFLQVLLDRKFSRSVMLASIMEDLPFRENKVQPHANGSDIVLCYRIAPSEETRIAEMRKQTKQLLHPYRFTLIKQAENNERIAHACGTCRFGDDPNLNVLDRDNRAHGIRNLFVVDSSFFPSSGGINPALTIAANALRVAEKILTV